MNPTNTRNHGSRAQFDDAFANLVRAWMVADNLRNDNAAFGPRSTAAAELMHARSRANQARLQLDSAA